MLPLKGLPKFGMNWNGNFILWTQLLMPEKKDKDGFLISGVY